MRRRISLTFSVTSSKNHRKIMAISVFFKIKRRFLSSITTLILLFSVFFNFFAKKLKKRELLIIQTCNFKTSHHWGVADGVWRGGWIFTKHEFYKRVIPTGLNFKNSPHWGVSQSDGVDGRIDWDLPLFFSPRRGEVIYAFPAGKDRMGQKHEAEIWTGWMNFHETWIL